MVELRKTSGKRPVQSSRASTLDALLLAMGLVLLVVWTPAVVLPALAGAIHAWRARDVARVFAFLLLLLLGGALVALQIGTEVRLGAS